MLQEPIPHMLGEYNVYIYISKNIHVLMVCILHAVLYRDTHNDNVYT